MAIQVSNRQIQNLMKIVFRVDASIQIGSGHVMRCLTLGDQFSRDGHDCVFICRAHAGHLGDLIINRGHMLRLIPVNDEIGGSDLLSKSNAHAHWLGVSYSDDFKACEPILADESADWLVVDHYSLDARWEELARRFVRRILVIDDLADREHVTDILLDQTFGREMADYKDKVPMSCDVLCGSQYSLLRPEFAEWRGYSLSRRKKFSLESMLVNLGGVDKDNVTCSVLDTLKFCDIPQNCTITVVMGETAPWVDEVRKAAKNMHWRCEVKVGVANMAEIMSDADLAVGAAGSSTWERCVVGLPSIQIIIAENQRLIARSLGDAGASKILDSLELLPPLIKSANQWMPSVSYETRRVSDGMGLGRLICRMTESL
jgi:UDP-2,4-diacetamido-2,4,6-trideoxy-beta-L-altropyranose hydrolase